MSGAILFVKVMKEMLVICDDLGKPLFEVMFVEPADFLISFI